MFLTGKVALVTGGGAGIGKAISEAFMKNGAKVAVASRNASRLKGVAESLKGLGSPVLTIQMDVRRKEEVRRVVAKVAETWGAIDILVNNAGLSGMTRIDDPEDERWYDIVETNLTGIYLVTKEVLKVMKDHAHGRIVNISSVLGKFGVPGYTAYCASKHGVIGFTKALALEVVKRGITVNAICPGWVDTDMARLGMKEIAAYLGMTVEEFERQALAEVPTQRFVDAEEVAQLVLYLATDKASSITGQAINVCGGQTMV